MKAIFLGLSLIGSSLFWMGSGCNFDLRNFNADLISVENYTSNFTDKIAKGEIRATVRRDTEVDELGDFLSAQQYNNVILLGRTGVGKTTLIHALAKANADGKFSVLKGQKIIQIDLAAIKEFAAPATVSPAQYIELIDRARAHYGSAIYFVDEIQTVQGAGFDSKAFGNNLKQLLDRVNRVIFATTAVEYAGLKVFHTDEALQRRLRKMILLEAKLNETVDILKALEPEISRQFGVSISDSNARMAAKLGLAIQHYAAPNSAINVIKFACSRAQIDGKTALTDDDVIYAGSLLAMIPVADVRADLASGKVKDSDFDNEIDRRNNETRKLIDSGSK